MQAVTLSVPDAIEGYARYMRSKGKRERSVKRFRDTLEKAAEALEWRTVSDIKLAPTVDWLAGKVSTGQWSGASYNTHASALRGFGRFLHAMEHTPANPFERLERANDDGEPGCRALTADEVRRLIKASLERCRWDGRAKGNAPLFWCFLAYTGLRHGEGAGVKWKDLDLERGFLTTDKAWAKNRRRQMVPLHPELRALLEAYRSKVPNEPCAPVFPHIPNRKTWTRDRTNAGIPYKDSRNRAATIHSLRKYLDTALDTATVNGERVPVGVRRRIIRHSAGLDDRYLDSPEALDVLAVSALPTLWPPDEKILRPKASIFTCTRGQGTIHFPCHTTRVPEVHTVSATSERVGRPERTSVGVTIFSTAAHAGPTVPAGRSIPSDFRTIEVTSPGLVPGYGGPRNLKAGNADNRAPVSCPTCIAAGAGAHTPCSVQSTQPAPGGSSQTRQDRGHPQQCGPNAQRLTGSGGGVEPGPDSAGCAFVPVAQLEEHRPSKSAVAGSIPAGNVYEATTCPSHSATGLPAGSREHGGVRPRCVLPQAAPMGEGVDIHDHGQQAVPAMGLRPTGLDLHGPGQESQAPCLREMEHKATDGAGRVLVSQEQSHGSDPLHPAPRPGQRPHDLTPSGNPGADLRLRALRADPGPHHGCAGGDGDGDRACGGADQRAGVPQAAGDGTLVFAVPGERDMGDAFVAALKRLGMTGTINNRFGKVKR